MCNWGERRTYEDSLQGSRIWMTNALNSSDIFNAIILLLIAASKYLNRRKRSQYLRGFLATPNLFGSFYVSKNIDLFFKNVSNSTLKFFSSFT
jgi:hypothetical protein